MATLTIMSPPPPACSATTNPTSPKTISNLALTRAHPPQPPLPTYSQHSHKHVDYLIIKLTPPPS